MIIKALSPSKFLLLAAAGIGILLPTYFVVIDKVLTPSGMGIPGSYKELLLTRNKGEKLIVDSGSNSFFGIEAHNLSNQLSRTVVNMADNAGYPLKHKFRYLARYAEKGDIILLPLEWQQYTTMEYPENYVTPILNGMLSYYYDSLPFKERFYIVYRKMPANIFLDALAKRTSSPFNKKWALKQLEKYKERLLPQNANSLGSGLATFNKEEHNPHQPCDSYIFSAQRKHGFVLGDDFKMAASYLNDAVKDGVRVIFTWPVVVDYSPQNRCYTSVMAKNNLTIFSATVREYIESLGFEIIGTPEESHYPDHYFNDTFYHLTEEGAEIRTRKLAKQLFSAGVTKKDDNYSVRKVIDKYMLLIDGWIHSLNGK